MPDSDHESVLELIPAHALNSLNTEEEEMVRRHLPGCDICSAELASYESVVDDLALAAAVAETSPALKEELIHQIHVEPSSPPSPSTPERGWRQGISEVIRNLLTGPRWRPVVLLFLIGLAVSNILLRQQLNTTDPNSWRRVPLTGSELAPEGRGIIYISADGRNGTLIVDQMPQLRSEHQYQLWLIKNGQRSSGAVFSVDSDGYRGIQIESSEPLQEFGAFGITVEPVGGSPGPTGKRILGSVIDG